MTNNVYRYKLTFTNIDGYNYIFEQAKTLHLDFGIVAKLYQLEGWEIRIHQALEFWEQVKNI